MRRVASGVLKNTAETNFTISAEEVLWTATYAVDGHEGREMVQSFSEGPLEPDNTKLPSFVIDIPFLSKWILWPIFAKCGRPSNDCERSLFLNTCPLSDSVGDACTLTEPIEEIIP